MLRVDLQVFAQATPDGRTLVAYLAHGGASAGAGAEALSAREETQRGLDVVAKRCTSPGPRARRASRSSSTGNASRMFKVLLCGMQ